MAALLAVFRRCKTNPFLLHESVLRSEVEYLHTIHRIRCHSEVCISRITRYPCNQDSEICIPIAILPSNFLDSGAAFQRTKIDFRRRDLEQSPMHPYIRREELDVSNRELPGPTRPLLRNTCHQNSTALNLSAFTSNTEECRRRERERRAIVSVITQKYSDPKEKKNRPQLPISPLISPLYSLKEIKLERERKKSDSVPETLVNKPFGGSVAVLLGLLDAISVSLVGLIVGCVVLRLRHLSKLEDDTRITKIYDFNPLKFIRIAKKKPLRSSSDVLDSLQLLANSHRTSVAYTSGISLKA